VRSPDGAELHAMVAEKAEFVVSGTIPRHARSGDIFLVNVAAHYQRTRSGREAIVEYLEVVYVKYNGRPGGGPVRRRQTR
jgi:hypothetical protein